MKKEVHAAVEFLKRLAQRQGSVDEHRLSRFSEKLGSLLCDKFVGHWYPENPSKGQAFRCIRVNRTVPWDDLMQRACMESTVMPAELGLPREFTVWIDPGDVCVRLGEGCRYFTVAHFERVDVKEEEEDMVKKQEMKERDSGMSKPIRGNPDTSDYHSASSSDCGSVTSSDNEEEVKDSETKGDKEKTFEDQKPKPLDIAMTPRIRAPRDSRKSSMSQPTGLQYFYHPVPAWSQYKKGPFYLTAVCPPSSTPVLRYYVLPKRPPQFIMPQATLQPLGITKG